MCISPASVSHRNPFYILIVVASAARLKRRPWDVENCIQNHIGRSESIGIAATREVPVFSIVMLHFSYYAPYIYHDYLGPKNGEIVFSHRQQQQIQYSVPLVYQYIFIFRVVCGIRILDSNRGGLVDACKQSNKSATSVARGYLVRCRTRIPYGSLFLTCQNRVHVVSYGFVGPIFSP